MPNSEVVSMVNKFIDTQNKIYELILKLLQTDASEHEELAKAQAELVKLRNDFASYDSEMLALISPGLEVANKILVQVLAAEADHDADEPDPLPPIEPAPDPTPAPTPELPTPETPTPVPQPEIPIPSDDIFIPPAENPPQIPNENLGLRPPKE